MAFKDTFRGLFNYFEIDGSTDYEDQEEESYQMANDTPKMKVAPAPILPDNHATKELRRSTSHSHKTTNLQRLHDKQQELLEASETIKTTIDIKFPKKYEEAPEIVNLLLENASVLIDFQFMSETQARRCLDYLDGARSVLSGNLKKISSTMWLLTPVNVTVNIEELRSSASSSETQFDFDMKR
ncbi:cell division protein SepF [Streptococcus ovis]|uniref:cell division protein SepF n=1 Tax=Streptococcus ovis TaxID=82806 RepID=UPI0004776CB3|nr:cell division protein SepF [Streptococcus ovis]